MAGRRCCLAYLTHKMMRSKIPFNSGNGGLIVSHGSPSDPEPQERFIRRLAERVAARTGLDVRGATLAKDGALEAAVKGLNAPWVFPHFMTDGWFVSTNLQNRLKKTGLADWTTLTPLGLSEALPGLVMRRLQVALDEYDLPRGETALIIAAHGSPSNTRPAEVTRDFAQHLHASGLFSETRVGFVDEDPSIEEAATVTGPALLLPFFAARAGHVLMDLPDAVTAAAFAGPVLAPIGTWDAIPLLISEACGGQRQAI